MNISKVKYLKSKVLSLLLAVIFVFTVFAACGTDTEDTSIPDETLSSTDSSVESSEAPSSEEPSSEEPSSEEPSSEEPSSEEPSSEEPSKEESSKEESSKPSGASSGGTSSAWPDKSWAKGWRGSPFDYGYPTPANIEDNIFWDSLVYTGYNIEKHIADGLMWEYILANYKGEYGWLSKIGYSGGSLGYETTPDGLPDIEYFEDHGLVCASYIAYVYFNYIPNVVGIDTSCLAKPTLSYSAHDWYKACQQWVEDGYCRTIDFKATKVSGFTKFEPAEEIPIGSIMCLRNIDSDVDYCRHVAIYAGYKNGYHWVYHVGNDNGPEFCAMERMSFGEGAQWPIAVFATPDFILEKM